MAKTPKGPKKQPSGDYEVGYGRPPLHTRTKHGQVLNPYGRNGKRASEPDAFEKARTRPSRVTVDGAVEIMPSDEAFYLLQMTRAMAGDKAAARIIADALAVRWRHQPPPPTAEELARAEAEEAKKRALAAQLVGLLEDAASAKKATRPRMVFRNGELVPLQPGEKPPGFDAKDGTEGPS